MPKYKIDDDGVLTIIDDKPSVSVSNIRFLTKRVVIVAVILAIALSAYSLLGEGPFAKGMTQSSWEQAMSADGSHTAAEAAFGNLGTLDPMDGLVAIASGCTKLFANFASNLGDFGKAVATSLGKLVGGGVA